MKPSLVRLLVFGVFMATLSVAAARGGEVSLAVKRGQESVDAHTLPFVSVTVDTKGAALPIQSITFENLSTHKKSTVILAKTFGNSHPDYLTALAGGTDSLSQAVLKMKPGKYRMLAIEFNLKVTDGFGSYYFDMTKDGQWFWFEVKPDRVNYVGTIVIAANWANVPQLYLNRANGGRDSTTFSIQVGVDDTAARDKKWSWDLIPALVNLPTVDSPLQTAAPATP